MKIVSASAIAVAILAGFAAGAAAQSRAEMPIPDLKNAYVDCERAALARSLDAGSTTRCSILYEELKRRAFDGDAARLRSWWKARSAGAGLS